MPLAAPARNVRPNGCPCCILSAGVRRIPHGASKLPLIFAVHIVKLKRPPSVLMRSLGVDGVVSARRLLPKYAVSWSSFHRIANEPCNDQRPACRLFAEISTVWYSALPGRLVVK